MRAGGWTVASMSLLSLTACVVSAGCVSLEPDAAPSEAVTIVRVNTALTSSTPAAPPRAPLNGTPRFGETSPMVYHGGHVLSNTTKVYYIWYGDWTTDMATVSTLESFAQTVGGSDYYKMNTTFGNACSQQVKNAVSFAGHTFDTGSQTNNISSVPGIVSRAITTGAFPADPDGVYFVLGAQNVTEGRFCSVYCGYHYFMDVGGVRVQYAFVGNARTQCPGSCITTAPTYPNEMGADGMASIISHELSEAVTDPWIDAWIDTQNEENGDKCNFYFGTTYATASGATANTHLGNKDFLLQTLWIRGVNGMCANALTAANAACVDGVQNGGESDVDCGGPCPACSMSQRCVTSHDCDASTCTSGICAPPNCSNAIKDGIESDVDCGELCAGCAVGKTCGFNSDCQSQLCVGGRCASHCANGVKDIDESDVDCGGSCGKCATGRRCISGFDCQTNGCSAAGFCVDHCADGVKDYNEPDVDCGDACPTRCALGKRCTNQTDCVNGQPCRLGRCMDHCTDHVKDLDETDVDCGGSGCPTCTAGMKCAASSDCSSFHCISGSCACATPAECAGGGTCSLGTCTNHCTNGKQDFGEPDLDCGGSCATKCGAGLKCNINNDCRAQTCRGGVCKCTTAADCAAGQLCRLGQCQDQCTDHAQDGDETDVDCGGTKCAPCAAGLKCANDFDCQSVTCRGNVCKCATAAADCKTNEVCRLGTCMNHCVDHQQDADETGLDCGGSTCALCPICYGP